MNSFSASGRDGVVSQAFADVVAFLEEHCGDELTIAY